MFVENIARSGKTSSISHSNPSVFRRYVRLTYSLPGFPISLLPWPVTTSSKWKSAYEISQSYSFWITDRVLTTRPNMRNTWPMAYFSSKKRCAAGSEEIRTVDVAMQTTRCWGVLTSWIGATSPSWSDLGAVRRWTRRRWIIGLSAVGIGLGSGVGVTWIRLTVIGVLKYTLRQICQYAHSAVMDAYLNMRCRSPIHEHATRSIALTCFGHEN